MDSIEKRLDYLTRQVKDLQDEGCNCCEGDGECNCGEEIGEILNTIKQLEKVIQEINSSSQECCNSIGEQTSSLEKQVAQLENQLSETIENVPGVRQFNNIVSPIPVNVNYDTEYSYGGDVYFRRFLVQATGVLNQQFNAPFNFSFNKALKYEIVKIEEDSGLMVFDTMRSYLDAYFSLGQIPASNPLYCDIRLFTDKIPGINLSFSSEDTVKTFRNGGADIFIDFYYTK